MTDSPRVALAPRSEAFAADAVAAGGGVVVDLADRPDADEERDLEDEVDRLRAEIDHCRRQQAALAALAAALEA